MLRRANAIAAKRLSRIPGGRFAAFPAHVTIEPTNLCNSRCLMCLPYRREVELPQPASGLVTWEVLRATESALRWARRLLLTGFGEPLMHPEFAEIVRWGKSHVPWVYMFTNGILMTAETARDLVSAGIDQVVFSVGGSTESVQRRVRGVGLESLIEGLEHLVRARGSLGQPEIRFNVVAMNSVLDDFDGIVSLASDYGVRSIDLPQMWVENAACLEESPLTRDDVLERLDAAVALGAARGVSVTVWDSPPTPQRCTAPFDSLWVAWNGDVYSCQFERYTVGNVLDQRSALKVWRSPAFSELRARVSSDPDSVCPNCPVTVGTSDSYLSPALHGRAVAPRFTADGPEHVESRRVLDRGVDGSSSGDE